MSTTEAVRTHLEALQREFYEVQAENRKLKEKNPQQAEALKLEQELSQSREENVQMAQEISELREAAQRAEQTKDAEGDEANETNSSAEEYAHELEGKLERTQQEMELERLRAVAEETRKWEEREARLVRRVEELEQQAKTVPELSGDAGGGGGWETRRGSTAAYSGETAARQLQDNARYAISTCVGGEVLSEPPIQPGKPDSVADISTDNRVGLSPDNLGVSVGTRSAVVTDAHYSGRNGSVGAQTLDVSAPEFVPPTTTATAVGVPAMLAGWPLVPAVTTNSRQQHRF